MTFIRILFAIAIHLSITIFCFGKLQINRGLIALSKKCGENLLKESDFR